MKPLLKELKKVPGVFWYMLILGVAGAITKMLEQFFPTNTYWVSSLIVSIVGGVLVPAIVYVWGPKYNNPELPRPQSSVMPEEAEPETPPSVLSTIFWGNR